MSVNVHPLLLVRVQNQTPRVRLADHLFMQKYLTGALSPHPQTPTPNFNQQNMAKMGYIFRVPGSKYFEQHYGEKRLCVTWLK